MPYPAAATASPRRPLPAPPGAAALLRTPLEAALNRALAAILADGRLDFLAGRVLALEAGDIALRWALTVVRGRLVVLPQGMPADTVIRGELVVFLRLARRQLDPDTAFFQRRLVVEGDTELALAAKNALDALDAVDLPRGLRRLLGH